MRKSMQVFLGLISALFLSMVLVRPLMRLAGPLKLIDMPDARKAHAGAIPRVGGLAIAAGTLVPLLLLLPLSPSLIGYLVGAVLIVASGVADDRFNLHWGIKFGTQALGAIALILGGVVFDHVPLFGFETAPLWVSVPVTLIFVLAVINGFNLLDGLDGLAAGCAVLSLAAVAALAHWCDADAPMFISVLAVGGILGFLRFNTHPAIIFMGDGGSQFIGFTIAAVVLMLVQGADLTMSPAIAVLLVGIPFLDTLFVIVQRLRLGRNPFSADRNHVHHKLLSLGLRHHEAVMAIYLVQALMMLAAFGLRFEADIVVLASYAAAALLCVGVFLALRQAQFFTARGTVVMAGANTGLSPAFKAQALVVVVWLLQAMTGLLLVGQALALEAVSRDVGLASLLLMLLLAVAAVLDARWRGAVTRIAVYSAAFLLSYFFAIEQGADVPMALMILVGAIVILTGLAIYLMPPSQFEVTTLDLLIVLLAGGLVLAPLPGADQAASIMALMRIFAVIYACEVTLSAERPSPGLIGGAALVALGIVGLRASVGIAPIAF